MRRSGFTMIELIFVIVILGILASVAIPKLAATRDDAKVSKALNELSTLKSDMSAYYTAHGTYNTGANNVQDMTNVAIYTNNTCTSKATQVSSGTTYYYCTPKADGTNEEVIRITPKNTDGELTIVSKAPANVTGNIAKALTGTDTYKTLAVTVKNGGSRVAY